MSSRSSLRWTVALVALIAVLSRPAYQRLTTLGVFRRHIENIHGVEALKVIEGTAMCEDLHHERISNHLFTACQQNPEHRHLWFPPGDVFTNPKATDGGSIVRIDPVTMKAVNLELKGFSGPLVTHGIDILNDPADASLLWIFAINHLPNPERWDAKPPKEDAPPEIARIEVFKHRLGTKVAEHVRSVEHFTIRMPNDILAVSPKTFYVTNDHVNYEGARRKMEDMLTQGFTSNPTTMYIEMTNMETKDPKAWVSATVGTQDIHNNNGIGRGSPLHPEEVIIIDAAGGVMVRAKRYLLSRSMGPELKIKERIHFASTLDNPSYYVDMYATAKNNASGYILPGLAQGYRAMGDFPYLDRPIPSLVWHLRSNKSPVDVPGKKNVWEHRLVFQDDGKALRSASGAVLIGIDPVKNRGKKQGWLFVTGFGSFNVVAAKIEL